MTEQVTNENLQILLTKLMTDRFCSQETSDLDACIQNYVPQNIDSSYVDQSLQRKGIKRCKPYQEVTRKCLEDDKKQTAIFRAAAMAPTCKREQRALQRCQGKKGRDCEAEALETVYCGMVYLVQRQKERQGASSRAVE
ncbi:putative mitochondrial hypothetical protein [Leptomonas pyrrhocoris]|uniref:Uncharacterized protein n=1 Tax=Leptomonas pyrrhocoris TaxID=157538 RepID=A0A0N0VH47_LEPPY|nr:putative mitochondrial hypothetical protein [Leptomonas pyrrhocoris]KPA84284.1 putative mitochondrial hypothetical protein [Leptomonas pyrrhocoris]|eukprot:XP_015662723.1 putative mitochondrial hypothetical protein [Leptomonas pyrrhocoris]